MKRLLFTASLLAAIGANAQINSPAPQGYRDRALAMYSDNNFIGCIDQMQYLKQEAPSSDLIEEADYYIALSSCHLKRIDSTSLLKYFLWKYPASVRCNEVRLTLAEIASDNHSYPQVLKLLGDIDPARLDRAQNSRYRFLKAVALLKTGDASPAENLFRSLLSDSRFKADSRFYLGYIAYTRGDWRKATELLRDCDTSRLPGSMADYYLAQIAFAQRDFSKALQLSLKLLSGTTVPQEYLAEACRIAGESQYNLGHDADAVKLLSRYVSLTPSPLPSALYILGLSYYREGNYPEAVAALTEVSRLDSAMGQSALLTIGQSLIAQGQYSAAMIALDKAWHLDFDPDVKELALYNYAVAKTEGGRVPFGSTVSHFEEFLRLFPDSPNAPKIQEYLVNGYITDNNLPAALASINAVARPSESLLRAKQVVLYTLGSREVAAGEYASAVNHLTQARALASHNPQIAAETDLWLGDAYFAQKDYDKARKSYQAAIKSGNLSTANRPLARYDLAYCDFDLGQYDLARQEFSDFVTSPGQSSKAMVADAYNRIADCHFTQSRFSDAYDSYAKALQLSPETGDYPLYQQAITKGLTSNASAKTDLLHSLISRFPNSPLVPQALLEIGLTYDQQRLTDKTVETYSQLAARYPATSQGREAQLLMALTYINNGNTSQAVDTYKRLITAAPTSDEASQAVESLKNLMAEQGRIGEFTSFMASVPSARQIDSDDLEATAFAAAERQYLANGTSSRLIDYIDRFPSGANLPQALAYAMKANAAAGDSRMTLVYASRLVNDFPDSPHAPEALLTLADTQLRQGHGEEALSSYTLLREKSSSPALTNSALLGIIHTARDLDRNDLVIEAADALLSSSTPTAAQLSEAAFSRGLALSLTGHPDEAETQWRAISSNLDDVNGTKAAYYIARQLFEQGETEKARTETEALIDSDTPHIYWLARGFILLSDIYRAQGKNFEADQYLRSLRQNYPGKESDIINLIDSRLQNK